MKTFTAVQVLYIQRCSLGLYKIQYAHLLKHKFHRETPPPLRFLFAAHTCCHPDAHVSWHCQPARGCMTREQS